MNESVSRVISVIVPVYNAEEYLENTFKALMEQTIFGDLEIILINDGSQDNSLRLCESFAGKHENVVLINQSNAGVAVARNAGLRVAKGKYITFLDSDDFVESDLYEKELKAIQENHADILVVDFKKKFYDGKIVKYRKEIYKKRWDSRRDLLQNFLSGVIGNQVVDKLFSAEILKNMSFSSDYRIGEDMYFTYMAISNANVAVMDTEIAGYHYIMRNSSAMNGDFSERFFDPIRISEQILQDCREKKCLEKEAYAHLIHEICKVIEYIYRHNAKVVCKSELMRMRKMLKAYSIKEARKYLIRKQFIGFLLMRMSPRIYLIIYQFMRIG